MCQLPEGAGSDVDRDGRLVAKNLGLGWEGSRGREADGGLWEPRRSGPCRADGGVKEAQICLGAYVVNVHKYAGFKPDTTEG